MSALHPLARRVEHPAPLRANVSPWLVLIGLFAAPILWSLQLLVSYGLDGDVCLDGGITAPGSPPKVALLAVIGLLALAGCLYGWWAAYQTWQRTRAEGPGDHHEGFTTGLGRTRFLGLCGLTGSTIFAIAALFELLVPFLVSPCATPFL